MINEIVIKKEYKFHKIINIEYKKYLYIYKLLLMLMQQKRVKIYRYNMS